MNKLSLYNDYTNQKSRSLAKLTVIIPTLNEESNIQRALDSVFFADEIIVIDSFSADRTVEIVRNNNIRLIQRTFDDFSSQKNFAIQQASHAWVLLVDADEEVTPRLQKEIRSTLSKTTEMVAYTCIRRNFVRKKKLKFGGHTNKIIRLIRKDRCTYHGLVHEKIHADGPVGALKGVLNHYTYKSFPQFKDKIEHYAVLRAKELIQKKPVVGFFHLYIKPLARFCIHYFLKLGFLDGREGFVFSYAMAYGVQQRFKELEELIATKNESRI